MLRKAGRERRVQGAGGRWPAGRPQNLHVPKREAVSAWFIQERAEEDTDIVTKLLGKVFCPGRRRVSSRSSPDHQPSSGVAVTAMMSPVWKSNLQSKGRQD